MLVIVNPKRHIQNFSYKQLVNGELIKVQHLYFPETGKHIWKGKEYSKKEWDDWINDLASYQ